MEQIEGIRKGVLDNAERVSTRLTEESMKRDVLNDKLNKVSIRNGIQACLDVAE